MPESFDQYCIVELFGHQRIAGKVSEQVIGGQGFIRVDVPELPGYGGEVIPGFTRLYGPGAIYSITPVSQEIADRFAANLRMKPVTIYELPSRNREDDD